MNMHFMCLLKYLFSVLWGIYLGEKLLDHMVTLKFMFNLSLLSSVNFANRHLNAMSGGWSQAVWKDWLLGNKVWPITCSCGCGSMFASIRITREGGSPVFTVFLQVLGWVWKGTETLCTSGPWMPNLWQAISHLQEQNQSLETVCSEDGGWPSAPAPGCAAANSSAGGDLQHTSTDIEVSQMTRKKSKKYSALF